MEATSRPRPLTGSEKALVDRLLREDFDGNRELARQIEHCRVVQVDSEGSLRFELEGSPSPASVSRRIPVEGEVADSDGVMVNVLLHVVNGLLVELEIYKEDGSPINRMPRADNIAVMVLPQRPHRRRQ